MSIRFARRSVVFLALLILAAQHPVFTQTIPSAPYVATDLGALGGVQSQGFGINIAAQVAGSAQRADSTVHAVLFRSGALQDLGTLGGSTSVATAINRAGVVVGRSLSSAGNTKAFVYANGAMRSLGTLGGSNSAAAAINDAGDIVGSASTTNNAATRAFLYRNGAMTAIGGTFGGTNSVATAINQFGGIAGYASTAGNSSTRAFLLEGGVMTNLGTLGGASEATAINDADEVVGRSVLASGARHAFYYSGGALTDIGTLGGTNSEAAGINIWSQIVGFSDVTSGGTHAFVYQAGTLRDLNTLLPTGSGWVLEAATAINDAGEIAGYGTHNGVRHAFRLAAPATLMLSPFGTLSQSDSNIPRNGVQVGRNVTFVTSISAAEGTARNITFTAAVSGPVQIASVGTYQGVAACTTAGGTVTCSVPALGPITVFDEEVFVTVRVIGPGEFNYTAGAVADNAPPPESVAESNIGIALSSLTLSAATIAGGKAVSTRVDLTSLAPPGGAVVHVVSSNPTVAPVPSQVIVQQPTAYRTFNIIPAVVSAPTAVTISATYGLVTISKTLTVVPPALNTVSLSRSTIIGSCQSAVAKVTLTGSAPTSGATVSLTATTAGANVPTSIVVPAGATSASLTVTTKAVETINKGTFTAAYGGVSKSLSLTVRPVYVSAVTLTPATVSGGTTVGGTVTSECAAPVGGLTVALSSRNATVAAPTVTSVVVPQGAVSRTFSVRTTRVAATTAASITATAHATTKSATLTVKP
jgi:probable HAF family extracellular repeat protein